MTLWIPRRGTSSGEYRRRMTLMVMVLETMLPASFTPQLSTSFFSASCPFYGRRQSGESTTLLLKATHIDIATAMALWIPRRGTSCGEYRRRMTLIVMVLKARLSSFFTPQLSMSFFSASCPFYGRRQSGESTTLLLKATHIDIAKGNDNMDSPPWYFQ